MMNGWCSGVVVMMGRVEGNVGCAVVGEGFVEDLCGLTLVVTKVGGCVRVVGILLLSVQVFEVMRHVRNSRSMVIRVFVVCIGIDWIVLVMVVVMGCGLGSVTMSVRGQVVMVQGWYLFDVATVEEF